MSDWLPSLNSLRAFEVVSRRLNYVHSAEELSVTPAAVKQLVSKLEATIGKKLVNRDGRNLALSDAGKSCQGALTAGFDQIQEAVNMMREQKNCHQLIVSVEPSFATAW